MKKNRETNNTSGKRVKSIREELGMTQPEFSELIGCSSNYISMFETGDRAVSLNMAKKFAASARYPTRVDWVMGETDERNEQEAAVHAYIERLDDLQWKEAQETSITVTLFHAFEKQGTGFTIECAEDAPAAVREKWDKLSISLASQFGSVVNIWKDGAIVTTITVKEFEKMKRRLERLAEAIVSEYIEEGDTEDGEH